MQHACPCSLSTSGNLPDCPLRLPVLPPLQPKMQSHLECRLWNDIFVDAQKALGIPNGALRPLWSMAGAAELAGTVAFTHWWWHLAVCRPAMQACLVHANPLTAAPPAWGTLVPAGRHHQGHVPHRDAARRL